MEKLDNEFRKASRALFGGEVGSLAGLQDYLSGYLQKPSEFSSCVSGRKVHASGRHYPKGARFVSFDEIEWGRKFEPLKINEIKDMDSAVRALGERFAYSGNVVLGKSRGISESTNVTDSFFVHDCNYMTNCEYAAFSSFSRNCSSTFTPG